MHKHYLCNNKLGQQHIFMTKITENTIEEIAIELLEHLGCQSRRDEIFVITITSQNKSSVGVKQKR
jgi:hypothetical protein